MPAIAKPFYEKYLDLKAEMQAMELEMLLPHAIRVIRAYHEVDAMRVRFTKDHVWYTILHEPAAEETKLPIELFLREDWEHVASQRRVERIMRNEAWRQRCMRLKEEEEKALLARLVEKYGVPK